MHRKQIENLLIITADITRLYPGVPTDRIAINVMKLQRLADSIARYGAFDGMQVKCEELIEKAWTLGKEIGMTDMVMREDKYLSMSDGRHFWDITGGDLPTPVI